MKKLRSVLLVLLAGIFCFGLLGCGKDGSQDWENIQKKGKFVVGYTLYEPFAYMEGNELTGFDVELAKEVAKILKVEVEFQKIVWGEKVTELNSSSIDVVWNAMTITPELKEAMEISDAYVNNVEVVVVKESNASKYATKEDIKASGKTIAVEGGSSGEKTAKEDDVLKDVQLLKAKDQIGALTEVGSGTCEFAIIDTFLFDSYALNPDSIVSTQKLVKLPIEFESEQFGIGFRKNSNFLAKVEEAFAEMKASGKYAEIAAKFNMTNALVKG